jgi:hypothetical protein
MSNCMGRGDDTPLSLDVAQDRNGLWALTIQESYAFKRVECQIHNLKKLKKSKLPPEIEEAYPFSFLVKETYG